MQYSNQYLTLQKPTGKEGFGMRRAFAKHNMGTLGMHSQQGPPPPPAPFYLFIKFMLKKLYGLSFLLCFNVKNFIPDTHTHTQRYGMIQMHL